MPKKTISAGTPKRCVLLLAKMLRNSNKDPINNKTTRLEVILSV